MMMGMGSDAWTINGRSYPDAPPIDASVGQRIRLRLFNMSMEDHPMHLHGHSFAVLQYDGGPITPMVRDSEPAAAPEFCGSMVSVRLPGPPPGTPRAISAPRRTASPCG